MFLKHNALGLSWALLILMLCGLPGGQFESSQMPQVDKAVHVILFGILFILLSVGFIKQSSFQFLRIRTLPKVFVMCLGYGLIIELMQAYVFVDRSIELMDIVFNTVGATVGLSLFLMIYGTKSYA